LGEQVKQKETLGLEVKVLEEARLGLMRKIGALVELPERELTCSKLAELAPPCCTPHYQALLARFKQLIGQVATVNEQNGLLPSSDGPFNFPLHPIPRYILYPNGIGIACPLPQIPARVHHRSTRIDLKREYVGERPPFLATASSSMMKNPIEHDSVGRGD
jgi:hypothetical protein